MNTARRRTRGTRGSPAASSGGCTSPSPRRCRAARRTSTRRATGARAERHRGADEDGALDPLGVLGREEQRSLRPVREGDEHGALRRRSRPSPRGRRPRTRPRRTPPRPRAVRPPLPRPSNVMTRKWRAKYGICVFQCREWTIDHVGRRRTVDRPAEDLVEDLDAIALDVARRCRVPRDVLLLGTPAPAIGRSLPFRRNVLYISCCRAMMNSRRRRLTLTGSRTCGACPDPRAGRARRRSPRRERSRARGL